MKSYKLVLSKNSTASILPVHPMWLVLRPLVFALSVAIFFKLFAMPTTVKEFTQSRNGKHSEKAETNLYK